MGLFLVQMVNQLWLGGVFMIRRVTDRICHFVTDSHAGHRAQGGHGKENGPKSSRLPDSFPFWEFCKYKLPACFSLACIWLACRGTHLSTNMTWARERGRYGWAKQSEADPGMLHPAWVILCPAMERWNLGSESEINMSSVNLWVKLHVWIYWWKTLPCSSKSIAFNLFGCWGKFWSKLPVERIHRRQS